MMNWSIRQAIWRAEFEKLATATQPQLRSYAARRISASHTFEPNDIVAHAFEMTYRRFPILYPLKEPEFRRYCEKAMRTLIFQAPTEVPQDPHDGGGIIARTAARPLVTTPVGDIRISELSPGLAEAIKQLDLADQVMIMAAAEYGPEVAAEDLNIDLAEFKARLTRIRQLLQGRVILAEQTSTERTWSIDQIMRRLNRSRDWVLNRLDIKSGRQSQEVYDRLEAAAVAEGRPNIQPDNPWPTASEICHLLDVTAKWLYPRLEQHRHLRRQRATSAPGGPHPWCYPASILAGLRQELETLNADSAPPGWLTFSGLFKAGVGPELWLADRIPKYRHLARSYRIGNSVRGWLHYPPEVKLALELERAAYLARRVDPHFYWREKNYPEVLKAQLRYLAKRLGRTPTATDLPKHAATNSGKPALADISIYWPQFEDALEAADLP